MKHQAILAAAALALAACQNAAENDTSASATQATPAASGEAAPAAPAGAESGSGQTWVTLFSGVSLDGWRQVGNANWHIVDNYVEADSGVGFLVTPASYGDFHLRVEFWTDEPANSGVFIRCSSDEDLSADTCYEVNIYDQRPDQTYRTGGIVNHAQPSAKIDAAGHWNTYEITAQGNRLLVRLNDTVTVDTEDDTHRAGPIGLQYGAGANGKGVVRFRNVQLIPL